MFDKSKSTITKARCGQFSFVFDNIRTSEFLIGSRYNVQMPNNNQNTTSTDVKRNESTGLRDKALVG